MIIVGLTGGIGHGKTSFANYLATCTPKHEHWESSTLICEVANGLRAVSNTSPAADDIDAINRWLVPLTDILLATVHVDPGYEAIAIIPAAVRVFPENYVKLFDYLQLMQAEPALQHVHITIANKTQFRPLLQWLGGYLVQKVDEGIWYDEIVRRVHVSERSGTQLATIGGLRFPGDAERLRNAGGSIIELQRAASGMRELKDITERDRNLIIADACIENAGSLEQLAACAKQVYIDLQMRQLQSVYTTTTFSV